MFDRLRLGLLRAHRRELARRRHLPRPRPLQGAQRLARPRRRRPRARHRRRAPARRRARPRHRRALRRRRVRHRLRGPARRRRGRRRRRPPRRRAARALPRRRPGDRAHRLGRHRRRRRRRRPQRRGPHPRRRRRDVPRQGDRQGPLRRLRRGRCAPARSRAWPTRSSCAARSPATSCACTTSPQFALGSGRVRAVEAHVNWQHPTRGLLVPRDFRATAEETGMVVPIGDWAIGEACAPARRWREAGAASDVSVSINVSALQLDRHRFDPADRACARAQSARARVAVPRDPRGRRSWPTPGARSRRSPSCAPSACGSRSTASAPAISR